MYVIRETFTAKPGMASKLAALLKEAVTVEAAGHTVRVLTDYIAGFNTVVIETEVARLDEFDQMMANYAANPQVREKMKGYTELWAEGRREVYRVV
jgi:hypothetical protein